MTDEKELKKLSRAELLELLLDQVKVTEKLEQELAEERAKLQKRDLTIAKAGTMAQAAIEINEVFSKADAAARQYYENVVLRSNEERELAIAEAERRKKEADEYCENVCRKLERFMEEHEWLREVLGVDVEKIKGHEEIKIEEE